MIADLCRFEFYLLLLGILTVMLMVTVRRSFKNARELTETKAKLEEALRIKSDFTATVSHELRTPLAAIKEGINIVFDGTTGPLNENQKKFLGIAQKNVDRLHRVVDDVLDFQKLEYGKAGFKFLPHNINEIVREVAESMIAVVRKKGLDLKTQLMEGLAEVNFDRDAIAQILTNLINNAIKFTDKGGIEIITSQDANVVKVSVKDTGKGISKEDIPKLFGEFVQLDGGPAGKTAGTGLGLAICRETINAHKGKIWVESSPGKGSTFTFVLPIKERRV